MYCMCLTCCYLIIVGSKQPVFGIVFICVYDIQSMAVERNHRHNFVALDGIIRLSLTHVKRNESG